jgi:transcriptional regulator with XRE-family HTH domain
LFKTTLKPNRYKIEVWQAKILICFLESRSTIPAEESGVGRSTIAALEAGERGAHPSTMRALARALGVAVPDLYRNRITPPPSQKLRPTGMAESYERLRYERLREKLRDAFPGVEYDADLERMAEQFVVQLGWLQERTFPLEIAHPRPTLSAEDLLELADSFYRFRVERWAQGEPLPN